MAGRLLSNRAQLDAGGDNKVPSVPFGNSGMRVMEAEFAFRMGKDLPARASSYQLHEVLEAVGSLHPAIEIPDSRYRDFPKVGAPQLIADNACAQYFVLGPATRANWRAIDLADHPVRVDISGKHCEGKGSNVMGDPRIALTWLANELATYTGGLRMGDVVTTGTCIVPAAIKAGDTLRADFGELGSVRADIGA